MHAINRLGTQVSALDIAKILVVCILAIDIKFEVIVVQGRYSQWERHTNDGHRGGNLYEIIITQY